MKDNKAKIYMISSLVVLVIAVIVSGTYAYYVWTTSDSDTTKIVAGVGAATVTFDGGSDISANLRPVSDKSKGIVKNINVKADATGLVFNMYLDITSIDTGLKDESFRYELYKGTTKVKEGNFSDSYLTSNTVTCSKNNTNHIVLLTNESISTSKTSYTLYIWINGVNYTNPNTMMNKTFSFKLHADGEGAVLKGPTAAETITKLYMNAAKATVTNNSITYNTAPSVSLMNDRLGGTTTDLDGGNIRYYGANPNNYIYFNCSDYSNQTSSTCETWRIIGVFDGKLKLIKGSQIGTYSWDNKNTSTGAENNSGKNDWTTARLMKLLNPVDYYINDNNDKDSEGNYLGYSLYYNSTSGKCYSGKNNATVDCDFTSTGIKNDETRNMIAETTYNLGGWNTFTVYPNEIYEYERGTTVYTGRLPTWTGKIALAYPSDYGYAADLNQCVNKQLNKYNDSTCTSNNWMKSIITNNGSNDGWLLTPHSNYSYIAWGVILSGIMGGNHAYYSSYGSAPVLYLSSELGIESGGDGSSSKPYKLSA